MPEAGPYQAESHTKGWTKGPMTVILVLVALVAAFFLAYALILIL